VVYVHGSPEPEKKEGLPDFLIEKRPGFNQQTYRGPDGGVSFCPYCGEALP
jgi:hypothetical protein